VTEARIGHKNSRMQSVIAQHRLSNYCHLRQWRNDEVNGRHVFAVLLQKPPTRCNT